MDDDMDEHEKLLNFQACVGVYDERLALTYLKNHGWDLAAAVNTYLVSVTEVGVSTKVTPGGAASFAAASAAPMASSTAATAASIPRVSSLSDGFQSASAMLSSSLSSSSSSSSARASASAGTNVDATAIAGPPSDAVSTAHTYTGFHLR